jgi:hypothetical protein
MKPDAEQTMRAMHRRKEEKKITHLHITISSSNRRRQL